MRTPGQLLSLTSHLSFGSGGGDSTYNSVPAEACENLLDALKKTSMKSLTLQFFLVNLLHNLYYH